MAGSIGWFTTRAIAAEMPKDVSIVQLLATPEKFNGKLVRVFGFLRLEFEGDALYFHKEDYEQGLTRNALFVYMPEGSEPRPKDVPGNTESINSHYVLMEGIFHGDVHGHMGLFGGGIKQITRIIPWPPPRIQQ